MGEYTAEGNLGAVPDNLTLPQFILDSIHPTRPIRKEGTPWFIDDTTGRKIGFEEVSREMIDDSMTTSPQHEDLLMIPIEAEMSS
jgi:hypothetical protein